MTSAREENLLEACETEYDREILTLEGDIIAAQLHLGALGYKPGEIDGVMGPKTTRAIRQFQNTWPLPVTGSLERCTANALIKAIGSLPPDSKPNVWQKPTKASPAITKPLVTEKPSVTWTTVPWNKERKSTFRLAQIHNSLLRGSAGSSIIPSDAIVIKNKNDFDQLTKNGVLIFYKALVKVSGLSRKVYLAHSGWNLYTNTHKVYLNAKESRPFRRDLKKRNFEHCEIDRDFSKPYTFCYLFYRDSVYTDLIYARGLDKRAGINNGNAKHKEWIFQLTNEGSIDKLADNNRKKYGENYQIPVTTGAIVLDLLKQGQKIDQSLGNNTVDGCDHGSIRDSVNGGFCPGKEPIPGRDY